MIGGGWIGKGKGMDKAGEGKGKDRKDLQSDDGKDNDDDSKGEDVGNAKGKAEDHGENAEPVRWVSFSLFFLGPSCDSGVRLSVSASLSRSFRLGVQ